MSLKRRVFKAGSWAIVKRVIKAIPFVGPLFSVGLAGYEIKKKGLVPGAVHVGLDVTPVVGTAKNVVEIFTGDWIPDKEDRKRNQQDQIPAYQPPRVRDGANRQAVMEGSQGQARSEQASAQPLDRVDNLIEP